MLSGLTSSQPLGTSSFCPHQDGHPGAVLWLVLGFSQPLTHLVVLDTVSGAFSWWLPTPWGHSVHIVFPQPQTPGPGFCPPHALSSLPQVSGMDQKAGAGTVSRRSHQEYPHPRDRPCPAGLKCWEEAPPHCTLEIVPSTLFFFSFFLLLSLLSSSKPTMHP